MSESTATPDDLPRLRVSSPADFVELVPYLIGFHPTDSLVLIALRGRQNQIALTMRVDLPAVLASSAAIITCLEHMDRVAADSVLLVVYDERAGDSPKLPHLDLVYTIGSLLDQMGIGVQDALLVGSGRWWSYACDDACCPPAGHPIDADRPPSPVRAAVAVAGMTAAPDRDAVARSLEPEPVATRVAVAGRCVALTEDRQAGRLEVPTWGAFLPVWRDALASQSGGETVLTEEDTAQLITGLADLSIRDECCRWAAAGSQTVRALAVLRQLARRAVPPWDAPPYALFGWFAWRDGDGALARMAIERALVADPGYRFAQLLMSMIDYGVDPRTWQDLPAPVAAVRTSGRGE